MSKKKNYKTTKGSIDKKTIIIVSIVVIGVVLLTLFTKKDTSGKSVGSTQTVVGGDLTIMKADITEEAKFYGYESNGTYMEVLAVRASDGTVRTALNTCQICNNSGRGYYVQEGDVFICQNCGNQFNLDDIELIRDGCNPVPLEKDIKIEDEEKVIIKGDSLAPYEALFTVWKK